VLARMAPAVLERLNPIRVTVAIEGKAGA
jgi:hypothetical protein